MFVKVEILSVICLQGGRQVSVARRTHRDDFLFRLGDQRSTLWRVSSVSCGDSAKGRRESQPPQRNISLEQIRHEVTHVCLSVSQDAGPSLHGSQLAGRAAVAFHRLAQLSWGLNLLLKGRARQLRPAKM